MSAGAVGEEISGGMSAAARPVLPRGVRLKRCVVRDAWFLLAPERALKLDPAGLAILRAVDGARDVAAIVDDLAARFGAPRERVDTDVRRFLGELARRRMVETAAGEARA